MTSWHDGVDATDGEHVPYMQVYFPAIRKDFYPECPKFYVHALFFCWWINYGRNSRNYLRTCLYYFSSPDPEFGDWSNWATPIHNSTMFSSHLRFHTITAAVFKETLEIIPHMIRSYYRYCCINEPVIFSHCIHLKLGHRFHALLKVCSDHDYIVPLSYSIQAKLFTEYMFEWLYNCLLSTCLNDYIIVYWVHVWMIIYLFTEYMFEWLYIWLQSTCLNDYIIVYWVHVWMII